MLRKTKTRKKRGRRTPLSVTDRDLCPGVDETAYGMCASVALAHCNCCTCNMESDDGDDNGNSNGNDSEGGGIVRRAQNFGMALFVCLCVFCSSCA